MEWTRENRYKRIEEVSQETLSSLKMKVESCQWRQTFHIQPPTGLLNDPNGFSYFNGEYHLFYQWFPLGPVHGLKYWYHTKSTDLVHWENVGVAIKPNKEFDSHGAYSGSGIVKDDKLYLMYTGNTRDENWVRKPYQAMAMLDKEGKITKYPTPVISEVPIGYTDHFRDPKVWELNGTYYAVIGAQRLDESGCVVLYESKDLLSWDFLGEVETDLKQFGYMWECPDYFELDDKGILLFSPQGLEPEGDRYHNIYQSGYLVGETLDIEQRRFTHKKFHELDRGFDFYAPQTMKAPDGRRLLVGWMGLPEIEYPTDENGWAHCLTIPRELQLKDDRLIQKPVAELTKSRKEKSGFAKTIHHDVQNELTGTHFELICELQDMSAASFGIEFRASAEEKTVLEYNKEENKIKLDRSLSGKSFGEEFGTSRSCLINGDVKKIQLFVDTSSVEIFINDGEEVFTSRIFPKPESDEIRFYVNGGHATVTVEKWDLI
ncbi:glycoside hydrolase family 32 protein [Metabacillus malikii]|uniref:Sucrose-6-phosphate hydrolase n=1 Tax=Metabacillus malikii TaxID=1504265 RepID=A0ABT9ZDN1_9BACI|nr:sucrose-6-phosphate hydrolase [Metabacillus malikii]MDQ0230367.1 beta-fructofuranosidase [Metabacillus malikii]